MAQTYKSSELEKAVEVGTVVLLDVTEETLSRSKERRGEGDAAKTVHLLDVSGTVYEYDNKSLRNSDYYRLLNQANRAKALAEKEKEGASA